MTETTGQTEDNATKVNGGSKKKSRRLTSRALFLTGAGVLVGAGGLAMSNDGTFAHGWGGGHHAERGHHRGGRHHGFHKAHWGGRWFGGGRRMTEEKAERKALRMADRLGAAVDATDDQQKKLDEIAKALVKDVYPLRAEMIEARKSAVDILTSENVDRAKLDELRNTQMSKAETAAERMTQALADAAEVLTTEQRSELKKKVAALRELGDWWRGGRRGRD